VSQPAKPRIRAEAAAVDLSEWREAPVPAGRVYDTVISALLYAGRLPVAVAIVVARSQPLVAKVAQAWRR